LEVPNGQTIEKTSQLTREAWSKSLDRLQVRGATPQNLTVLYTSFAHTLVYPYEMHEPTPSGPEYYSGYLDSHHSHTSSLFDSKTRTEYIVPGKSYSGYSIWDTFRATTAWQLLVTNKMGEMIQSMLQDYQQGGWLPMWKNIVETNIMVGTHADSIIAQAMGAGKL
jgi:putative alpha-1,2-mannosidase